MNKKTEHFFKANSFNSRNVACKRKSSINHSFFSLIAVLLTARHLILLISLWT